MENNKTPSIRFKGFTDPWEQRKLGDIVGIYDGVHQTPNYQNSGVMFLSVENIATLKSSKFISEEDFKRNYKIFPQENDILMTRIGDVGTTNVVTDNSLKAYYVSLALLKYKSTDPYFLSNAIQSDYVQKGLANRTLKTAIPMKINKDEIGKVSVMLPLSATEQQQIGTYFRNLDNLITLHQRKYNKLLNVKKSMLEKMFPKNGSNIPEIRFKGFTDPWEQRKFGDIGSIAMCKRIFKEQTSDEGEVPFYKIGTFGVEPDAFISKELFDEYKTKYPYPNKGDILISASGSIGRTVEFTGKDEYFQDSNIVWLKHGNEIDNSFLKVLYSVVEWSCEGSTIKRLYNDNFLKTEFMLPQIDEQIKLGTYFSNLDHLITLHQHELEKLQNIKKSMLEKMFV